jgi:hypothetical protein
MMEDDVLIITMMEMTKTDRMRFRQIRVADDCHLRMPNSKGDNFLINAIYRQAIRCNELLTMQTESSKQSSACS